MTPLYAGIGGVVRELTEMHTGINGVVTPLTEMWAGINGVERQIFSAVTGKQAGEYAIGDTVYLNENGQNVGFIVSAQNYESELNGNGRTLLVRNTWLPDTIAWDTNGGLIWSQGSLDSYLNTLYLGGFDEKTKHAIGTTKFKYYSSVVYPWSSATIEVLDRPIFILSIAELIKDNADYSGSSYYSDGDQLPSSAILVNKVADNYVWTRTPYRKAMPTSPSGGCTLFQGYVSYYGTNISNRCFAMPALTVSSDTQFDPNTNIML